MPEKPPLRTSRVLGRGRWRKSLAAGVVAAAALCAAGPSQAATGSPDTTMTRVAAGGISAARGYWTAGRMADATPVSPGGATPSPPPGTPEPVSFAGVPTVGALFFTTGSKRHFCTASTVAAPTRDLVLTAAHCVYSTGYTSDVVYVPGYHDGVSPYGAWPVTTMLVSAAWQGSHDPDSDYAFLSVAPPSGTTRPLESVTGALLLGADTGYDHQVEVIGYNDTDDAPIGCATTSTEFEPHQMTLNCDGYWSGTSGGPWITHFDPATGSGVLVGDIGGYETGGDYAWTSYSPYYDGRLLLLYARAEAALRAGG